MIQGIMASVQALRVHEKRLNQTAHNVANVSTTGFVPERLEQGDIVPGGGSRIIGSTPLAGGPITTTDGPLDLAISGPGFFALNDPNQGIVYSRAGNFQLDAQGRIVYPQGRVLQPEMTIPAEATQVHVAPNGQITALGPDGAVLAQGQIETASFGNPGGLEALGNNVYRATPASGPAVNAAPATVGHGEIVPGALQSSGTNLAREMVNMIIDRRAFQANVASVKTEDEMLGTIMDMVG